FPIHPGEDKAIGRLDRRRHRNIDRGVFKKAVHEDRRHLQSQLADGRWHDFDERSRVVGAAKCWLRKRRQDTAILRLPGNRYPLNTLAEKNEGQFVLLGERHFPRLKRELCASWAAGKKRPQVGVIACWRLR